MITPVEIAAMSNAERHSLAVDLLRAIDNTWHVAEDGEKWQQENVEEYGATMSFDELVAEVAAIEFKKTEPVGMTRVEKYELACDIVSDISDECQSAEDSNTWMEERTTEYNCELSLLELVDAMKGIKFNSKI